MRDTAVKKSVSKLVSKNKYVLEMDTTLSDLLPPQKKHLKRNPVITIMRYLSTYRYECTNRLEDKTFHCSCWRDVQDKTGIPRSSLHLILNEKYINKYRHWKISKCNIKKDEKELIHLT